MNMEDMEGYLKENPIGQVWHNCNTFLLAANLTDVPVDEPQPSEFYRNWTKEMSACLKIPPFFGIDRPGDIMATDQPGMQSLPVIGASDEKEKLVALS